LPTFITPPADLQRSLAADLVGGVLAPSRVVITPAANQLIALRSDSAVSEGLLRLVILTAPPEIDLTPSQLAGLADRGPLEYIRTLARSFETTLDLFFGIHTWDDAPVSRQTPMPMIPAETGDEEDVDSELLPQDEEAAALESQTTVGWAAVGTLFAFGSFWSPWLPERRRGSLFDRCRKPFAN